MINIFKINILCLYVFIFIHRKSYNYVIYVFWIYILYLVNRFFTIQLLIQSQTQIAFWNEKNEKTVGRKIKSSGRFFLIEEELGEEGEITPIKPKAFFLKEMIFWKRRKRLLPTSTFFFWLHLLEWLIAITWICGWFFYLLLWSYSGKKREKVF